MKKQKVQCTECFKVTAGVLPKGGDGSLLFPRRHYIGGNISSTGKICPGVFTEGKWVV